MDARRCQCQRGGVGDGWPTRSIASFRHYQFEPRFETRPRRHPQAVRACAPGAWRHSVTDVACGNRRDTRRCTKAGAAAAAAAIEMAAASSSSDSAWPAASAAACCCCCCSGCAASGSMQAAGAGAGRWGACGQQEGKKFGVVMSDTVHQAGGAGRRAAGSWRKVLAAARRGLTVAATDWGTLREPSWGSRAARRAQLGSAGKLGAGRPVAAARRLADAERWRAGRVARMTLHTAGECGSAVWKTCWGGAGFCLSAQKRANGMREGR